MDARRIAVIPALVASLALAACGGSNDPAGEPPTTAPPAPADTEPADPQERDFPAAVVDEVEPICTRAQDEVDKLSPIEDEQGVQGAVQLFEDTSKELEGVDVPEQNAEAYKTFVDAYRDAGRTLGRIEGELARGDSSALQRVTPVLDEMRTRTNQLASDFGFEECAGE